MAWVVFLWTPGVGRSGGEEKLWISVGEGWMGVKYVSEEGLGTHRRSSLLSLCTGALVSSSSAAAAAAGAGGASAGDDIAGEIVRVR